MTLSTTQDLRAGPIAAAAFADVSMREGLTRIRRATFPAGDAGLEALEPLGDVLLSERTQGGRSLLVRLERRMVVFLWIGRGHGEISVAGDDAEAVDRTTAELVGTLRRDRPADDQVAVTFWARSHGPPMNPRRAIPAPAWSEIRDNYAEPARQALDRMMSAASPGPGGLVLWHGEPGTGKSTALRALAREWRTWCDMHFVADPDVFLGSDTNYLLSALLRRDDGERWRLLVLEDAGELLAADARAVAGQAVSRLLNLTDGLLGLGLRTLVLVTTNEPVGRLHPAVARPGRCWMEIEFPLMPADDANAWLERHGADARVQRATSLAGLYALRDGREVGEAPGVGFGA